MTKIFVKLF